MGRIKARLPVVNALQADVCAGSHQPRGRLRGDSPGNETVSLRLTLGHRFITQILYLVLLNGFCVYWFPNLTMGIERMLCTYVSLRESISELTELTDESQSAHVSFDGLVENGGRYGLEQNPGVRLAATPNKTASLTESSDG